MDLSEKVELAIEELNLIEAKHSAGLIDDEGFDQGFAGVLKMVQSFTKQEQREFAEVIAESMEMVSNALAMQSDEKFEKSIAKTHPGNAVRDFQGDLIGFLKNAFSENTPPYVASLVKEFNALSEDEKKNPRSYAVTLRKLGR